jgi:signal transduction histidine kinase
MHKILGAPLASLVGTSIQSRLASDGAIDEMASLISDAGSAHREVVLMREDDSACLLAITTTMLEVDGERAFAWACRDITWQRHVERALLGASGRDASSAAVSLHEGLAQELAGVSLFLGSTMRHPQSEHAGTIQTATQYLSAAIRTARDLAQFISPTTPVRGSVGTALGALCAQAQLKLRVPIEYAEASCPAEMNTATGDQIYRMVEDALTASGKADGCSRIRVASCVSNANFRIDIRWSTAQAANARSQFIVRDLQLDLIAHRARLLGGASEHGRQEDGEFLIVRIPISTAADPNISEGSPEPYREVGDL